MELDLLIPFSILLVMVVYFIYSRTKYEKEIVSIYEKKFDNWKEQLSVEINEKKESKKELVGLVFKKDGKIDIEFFDESSKRKVENAKFSTKIKL